MGVLLWLLKKQSIYRIGALAKLGLSFRRLAVKQGSVGGLSDYRYIKLSFAKA